MDVGTAIDITRQHDVLMKCPSQQVEKQSFITLSDAKKLEIREEAEERYLAYVFLKQSAKTSEKLRTSISDNYNIGDKKYPTTQKETFHYLEKHSRSFVSTPPAPEGSSFSQKGGDTFDNKFWKNKECFDCGKKGHPSTHCTSGGGRIGIVTMTFNQAKQARCKK